MIEENAKYHLHKKRLKKFIEWLAYGSLFLDICIAIITLSTMFHLFGIETLLGTVNIALTVVVIFSIISATMIVGIKFYEGLLFKSFTIKARVRHHVDRVRHNLGKLRKFKKT